MTDRHYNETYSVATTTIYQNEIRPSHLWAIEIDKERINPITLTSIKLLGATFDARTQACIPSNIRAIPNSDGTCLVDWFIREETLFNDSVGFRIFVYPWETQHSGSGVFSVDIADIKSRSATVRDLRLGTAVIFRVAVYGACGSYIPSKETALVIPTGGKSPGRIPEGRKLTNSNPIYANYVPIVDNQLEELQSIQLDISDMTKETSASIDKEENTYRHVAQEATELSQVVTVAKNIRQQYEFSKAGDIKEPDMKDYDIRVLDASLRLPEHACVYVYILGNSEQTHVEREYMMQQLFPKMRESAEDNKMELVWLDLARYSVECVITPLLDLAEMIWKIGKILANLRTHSLSLS